MWPSVYLAIFTYPWYLVEYRGTLVLELHNARSFRSSSNIFEKILFRCSTTCSALNHRAKRRETTPVPVMLWGKQRGECHLVHRSQAVKSCSREVFTWLYIYILLFHTSECGGIYGSPLEVAVEVAMSVPQVKYRVYVVEVAGGRLYVDHSHQFCYRAGFFFLFASS